MAIFAAKGAAKGKETGRKVSARAFRQMTVDRLCKCDNVVALSEELGVHRRFLYKWRQQMEPLEPDGISASDTRDFTLTKELCWLKRLLGEKVQEVDLFRGALRKIELDARTTKALARGHLRPIREVMSIEGKLSVERMCALTAVSRAGFYRSLHEREPDLGDGTPIRHSGYCD